MKGREREGQRGGHREGERKGDRKGERWREMERKKRKEAKERERNLFICLADAIFSRQRPSCAYVCVCVLECISRNRFHSNIKWI